MPQDSVPNEDAIGQSEETSLEQRVTALEEQNEELKAKLEQQQDGRLPTVS